MIAKRNIPIAIPNPALIQKPRLRQRRSCSRVRLPRYSSLGGSGLRRLGAPPRTPSPARLDPQVRSCFLAMAEMYHAKAEVSAWS